MILDRYVIDTEEGYIFFSLAESPTGHEFFFSYHKTRSDSYGCIVSRKAVDGETLDDFVIGTMKNEFLQYPVVVGIRMKLLHEAGLLDKIEKGEHWADALEWVMEKKVGRYCKISRTKYGDWKQVMKETK